jgi:hypothetical protein
MLFRRRKCRLTPRTRRIVYGFIMFNNIFNNISVISWQLQGEGYLQFNLIRMRNWP